jgi:hypothetical protein
MARLFDAAFDVVKNAMGTSGGGVSASSGQQLSTAHDDELGTTQTIGGRPFVVLKKLADGESWNLHLGAFGSPELLFSCPPACKSDLLHLARLSNQPQSRSDEARLTAPWR